jgi:hypothetical protein
MSTKPTPDQVAAEIKLLAGLLPRVRPTTAFGDDNRTAIEAQIIVLTERMDLDDVYDRFGEDAFLIDDGFDQYVLDSAMEAHDWLHGLRAADEDSPAKSWEGLAQ